MEQGCAVAFTAMAEHASQWTGQLAVPLQQIMWMAVFQNPLSAAALANAPSYAAAIIEVLGCRWCSS